jgi:hypothetical protein
MVWVADPVKKQVEVYAPDQAPKTLTGDDKLDGGVLPGSILPVKAVFPA